MLEIGHNIRKARLIKGYNQEYMAGKMHISQEAYSKIEANKTLINYGRLDAISEILDMSIEDILTMDEKGNVYNNVADQQHHFAFHNGYATEKKLIEELILEKDKRIEMLEKMLEMKNEELKKYLK